MDSSLKIKIGSRKSHLARYQAYLVGMELKKKTPGLEIEYSFKESLGDINLIDPLWKMPEKGVFTEDFLADLRQKRVDLVVHSWKDLPTFERSDTFIAATLPRADTRDLLLVKKTALVQRSWEILCSSPRRQRNLPPLLSTLLPQPAPQINFAEVRGNIPTRIRKLMEGASQGLVLAKAALDRLLGWQEISSELSAEEKLDFAALEKDLRAHLKDCTYMLLPVSENPPAAAQGALAIEILKLADAAVVELVNKINCRATFSDVMWERDTLASFGGGCHQAIGAWALTILSAGQVTSLKGQTDAGETLNGWKLGSFPNTSSAGSKKTEKRFPRDQKNDSLTNSRAVENLQIPTDRNLFVTKHLALPHAFSPSVSQLIWAAGLSTWKKLAARGIWVHGCSESLGENMAPGLDTMVGVNINFLRLTHQDAATSPQMLGTYQIFLKQELPDLTQFESFFWTSGTVFKWALEKFPSLKDAEHACGPGQTFKTLQMLLPPTKGPKVYLNHASWLSEK